MKSWDQENMRGIVTGQAGRGRIFLALTLAALAAHVSIRAQSEGASEYAVKAAYLYNFAKSFAWSEQSLPESAPLVIGVEGGDDEFIDAVKKTVAGRTAGAHPIKVQRVDSGAELNVCQIVFFRASTGRKRVQAAIAALQKAAVLSVGEDEEFLSQGGAINLVLKKGVVHFEVDRPALERNGFHLSPALLALASPRGALSNGAANEPEVSTEARRLRVSSPPEYPEIAQRMNIRGVAQVEASVRRDGTVAEVKVIGGHPLLADALVKAVMHWKYEPSAKESQVTVRFVFGP